ncbi:MAG: MFS transporter [Thioalkalispiraceae bacterium]|jgi:MFS family permease
MAERTPFEQGLGWLYDQATGDEDARVCKDIPDEACVEQPRNFFAYLFANLLNKISDELVSARVTLPWLFNLLGIPATFTGFLVPIREAGVLLPQLFVAAYVRNLEKRKIVWLIGALLSALSLFLMAAVTWQTDGLLAGWLILALLVFYSLARGLCSVSAKDVLGKTISKTRRGRLMGYSTALAGVVTLAVGLILVYELFNQESLQLLIIFILGAASLWILAFGSFISIKEPAGATEGGGNAIAEALRSLKIVVNDKPFQQYVISRTLFLSIALVIPFYVLLAQQQLEAKLSLLGWLIIANGLANILSAPLIGKFADKNSRNVMTVSALTAGFVGIVTWYMVSYSDLELGVIAYLAIFFLITLAHGAVRLGRKVYLVDMATAENRARYVAVSNTLIGVAMFVFGGIGVLADLFNIQSVILVLSVIALIAGSYTHGLPNVSG